MDVSTVWIWVWGATWKPCVANVYVKEADDDERLSFTSSEDFKAFLKI